MRAAATEPRSEMFGCQGGRIQQAGTRRDVWTKQTVTVSLDFLVSGWSSSLGTDGAPPLTQANLLALDPCFHKYLVTVALFSFYLQLGFVSFDSGGCERAGAAP